MSVSIPASITLAHILLIFAVLEDGDIIYAIRIEITLRCGRTITRTWAFRTFLARRLSEMWKENPQFLPDGIIW